MAGKGNSRGKNRNQKNTKVAPVKTIKVGVIDYKDVATLRKFVSERGKIRARRITGVSVQEQRWRRSFSLTRCPGWARRATS